ncbi:MAG: hypothetical protein IPP94_00795 [Ignavibacteria bacterium]|nr:hypothetical protein [Ignavibacteria bacterium]
MSVPVDSSSDARRLRSSKYRLVAGARTRSGAAMRRLPIFLPSRSLIPPSSRRKVNSPSEMMDGAVLAPSASRRRGMGLPA